MPYICTENKKYIKMLSEFINNIPIGIRVEKNMLMKTEKALKRRKRNFNSPSEELKEARIKKSGPIINLKCVLRKNDWFENYS